MFSARSHFQLVQFDVPTHTRKADSPHDHRLWAALSAIEKRELFAFLTGEHANGLARIDGRWPEETLSKEGDLEAVRAYLQTNQRFIESDDKTRTYVRVTLEDFIPNGYCIVNKKHDSDAAILEALGILKPVLTLSYIVDGGAHANMVEMNSQHDYLYVFQQNAIGEWQNDLTHIGS
jgi:hypothetical protein